MIDLEKIRSYIIYSTWQKMYNFRLPKKELKRLSESGKELTEIFDYFSAVYKETNRADRKKTLLLYAENYPNGVSFLSRIRG